MLHPSFSLFETSRNACKKQDATVAATVDATVDATVRHCGRHCWSRAYILYWHERRPGKKPFNCFAHHEFPAHLAAVPPVRNAVCSTRVTAVNAPEKELQNFMMANDTVMQHIGSFAWKLGTSWW